MLPVNDIPEPTPILAPDPVPTPTVTSVVMSDIRPQAITLIQEASTFVSPSVLGPPPPPPVRRSARILGRRSSLD